MRTDGANLDAPDGHTHDRSGALLRCHWLRPRRRNGWRGPRDRSTILTCGPGNAGRLCTHANARMPANLPTITTLVRLRSHMAGGRERCSRVARQNRLPRRTLQRCGRGSRSVEAVGRNVGVRLSAVVNSPQLRRWHVLMATWCLRDRRLYVLGGRILPEQSASSEQRRHHRHRRRAGAR